MTVLVAHLAATWALVGLIWTIQLVHYRLFDGVGDAGWAAYHARHMAAIAPLVGTLMLVELATAAYLVARTPPGVAAWMPWAGVALVSVVWVSTAVWQVPQHNRLAVAYDADLARALVHGNWLRTIVWTLRGVLAAWMLLVATRAV